MPLVLCHLSQNLTLIKQCTTSSQVIPQKLLAQKLVLLNLFLLSRLALVRRSCLCTLTSMQSCWLKSVKSITPRCGWSTLDGCVDHMVSDIEWAWHRQEQLSTQFMTNHWTSRTLKFAAASTSKFRKRYSELTKRSWDRSTRGKTETTTLRQLADSQTNLLTTSNDTRQECQSTWSEKEDQILISD